MFDYQNVFIKIESPDNANLDHCQREFLYFYVYFHILNKDSNIVLIIAFVEYIGIEPQSLKPNK